jgi:hypothetical protein
LGLVLSANDGCSGGRNYANETTNTHPERYVYHAEQDLLKFAKGQEKCCINEFSADELEKWIDGYRNPKTGKPWGLSSKKRSCSLQFVVDSGSR